MTTGELGTWLALIFGLGGAFGVFFGGLLADRLAPRNKRWYVWLPALSCLVIAPFHAAAYLAERNRSVVPVFRTRSSGRATFCSTSA